MKTKLVPTCFPQVTLAILVLALSVALTALPGTAYAQPISTNQAQAEVVAAQTMLGFSPAHETSQRVLEAAYDGHLDPADQKQWLEQMASEPNHVGSPHNKANAEFMLAKFREWGWEARIETFYVLYPTPKQVSLKLENPPGFVAQLSEIAYAQDRTSHKGKDALPPYNVYGADGDAVGELVYVNEGMPEDYDRLARFNISVTNRIVIARYGGGWRGLKPKLAAEHGAIGCIIYSDPQEDGYGVGDVYPEGGYRPAHGVQRGSVLDLPVYPGDPLTPFIGATRRAKRLAIREAKTILKIPVLPISSADALPLLSSLAGPVAPSDWRGALPLTYHIGPGPARARLTIISDWSQKAIYNVVAVMEGNDFPDEWVIRGNHHDGWVFGAWDPLSANVSLMAEAKAIGALVKNGWRPRRTLVYASWDAEEPGLIGSTEWVEMHADELRRKVLLYVNSDTNARGFLRAGGSHSYEALVNEVAASVPDPQTAASVLERLRAKSLVDAFERSGDEEPSGSVKRFASERKIPLKALGSGSDFTPFLQHLGVASLDIRFGGEDDNIGVYHSLYDSYDHFVRFGDPDFLYGVTLAKTIGRVMLRVSEADVIPMRFADFEEKVSKYVSELKKLLEVLRERTEQENELIRQNAYKLAADPKDNLLPPEKHAPVPFLNFAPLDNAVVRLKQAARLCDDACARAARLDGSVNSTQLARLNRSLRGLEQALTHPDGLPGRNWYRHMIYAPGLHTGYDVKTLPGAREAIENRNWAEAAQYISIIAGVLDNYSERLEGIGAILRR